MIKYQRGKTKVEREKRTKSIRRMAMVILCMSINVFGLTGCNKVENKVLEKEFKQAVGEMQEDSMNVNYAPQSIATNVQSMINEYAGLEVPIYQIYYTHSVAIVQTELNGEPKMFKVTIPVNTDKKEWTVVEYELHL